MTNRYETLHREVDEPLETEQHFGPTAEQALENQISGLESDLGETGDEVPDYAKTTIKEILTLANEYGETNAKKWAELLTKLENVIADYSTKLEEDADDQLELLAMDAKRLKNDSIH